MEALRKHKETIKYLVSATKSTVQRSPRNVFHFAEWLGGQRFSDLTRIHVEPSSDATRPGFRGGQFPFKFSCRFHWRFLEQAHVTNDSSGR
jgi:hypothetical protein